MRKVITVLCIIALTLALGMSMSFASGKTPYTMTVASSNPASGVVITVTKDNTNKTSGTTPLTLTYFGGTVVTLTAPATAGGNNFSKWQKGGVDYATTASTSVTINANMTMTAVYTPPTGSTYTLTVASSNPASGVAITVSPNDNGGLGNGSTQFTRTYNSGASVILTAPATASGNNFSKWQKGGVDYATTASTSVSMTANTTMTAVYVTPGSAYTLTVASSNPASGVAITVSPNDNGGLGNGSTQFTRTYNSGTSVTLTAPATASGNNFSKWQKGGVDYATTANTSVSMTANTTMTAVYVTQTASNYKVLAYNDLGMHCACPGAETFLVLPPFNTIRAQVFQYGGNDPVVVSSGVNVTYSMLDNNENDNYLINTDPYYKNVIAFSPKMFPIDPITKKAPFEPVHNGQIISISGATLAGNMTYNATPMAWEVVGVPAFPVTTGTSSDVMKDPLAPTTGAKRTPYLTAQIKVTDNTGAVLATTNTTVPVAFGGCCSCHIQLAGANGYTADTAGSFKYMGKLHATVASAGRTVSKIDLSYIDPDGDGAGGPVRCSWCHWDPAMGESSAPGLPATWPNYTILPGATFTKADIKVSQYSFSDVLHTFHAKDNVVLTQYDPNIAKNCYDCHPGNMTGDSFNCYRGAMKSATIWCVDCHGDLNQRVATNQVSQPWQQSTLPTCNGPSAGITTVFTCHDSRTYPTPGTWAGTFGKFINSRGHKGSILCSTCHGSPHAEAPSTLSQDQTQLKNAQGDAKPLGVCTYCHPGKSSSYGVPPHGSIRR